MPRWLARLVSAYERAPLADRGDIFVLPLLLEPAPLWLARRIAFALAGRDRGDGEPRFDAIEVPSSGWRGSLLVPCAWLAGLAVLLAAGAMLLL